MQAANLIVFLNGFYLQELMHRYVELLGNVVTENKEN